MKEHKELSCAELGGRSERDQAGNEGHFSNIFPSSHTSHTNSELFTAVPFPNFSSHFLSHILLSLPNSLIPFQFSLALCFYFSIDPNLIVFINLINRTHAPKEHPEKLNTLCSIYFEINMTVSKPKFNFFIYKLMDLHCGRHKSFFQGFPFLFF